MSTRATARSPPNPLSLIKSNPQRQGGVATNLVEGKGHPRSRSHPDLAPPQLTENALRVLEKRYLNRNETGKAIENPTEMFWRVAKNLAQAEALYGATDSQVETVAKEFYRLMSSLEFLPNSPTLMNAGNELQQLAACFVLPIDDSIEGIFNTLKHQALIHKSGGGTGFAFSRLRPKNDFVQSTSGVASGPVSFMKIFDAATQQIKQGGKRRGANMGILRVDHPDILEFIACKDDITQITNFNISVAVTDTFMRAVRASKNYDLLNPRTRKNAGQLNAREVFDKIAQQAWKNGEPGLFFIDKTNAMNSCPALGEIEATNPCGEQPLLSYESCNLGSINLGSHLRQIKGKWEVDWKKLERNMRTATRLLDDVIDMNKYPVKQIEEMTKRTRKIGLGVMGFARLLFKLGIPYDSDEALAMARKVMKAIQDTGFDESKKLAAERGVFPAWDKSVFKEKGLKVRNSAVTTVAPTGTLSMIADASGGCEPEYSLIWYKRVMEGERLPYVLDYFIEVAKREGFWTDVLMKKIAENKGSVRGLKEVPEKWQRVFVTAHDASPDWHVKMQAAFQEFTDSAVSKTINMPKEATVEDVKSAYMLAYDLGCKGITVYRDGSRAEQVMNVGTEEMAEQKLVKEEGVRKPRARPDTIEGRTQKIITGYGSLYITINEDDKGLFEVFAQIGRAGGYTDSFTEALARLISLCLRSGIPVDEIIDQLEGIRSPRIAIDHQERIFSIPDALAKALKRHMGITKLGLQPPVESFEEHGTIHADDEMDKEHREDYEVIVRKGLNPECPECGNALVYEEGCVKCHTCGYSEC